MITKIRRAFIVCYECGREFDVKYDIDEAKAIKALTVLGWNYDSGEDEYLCPDCHLEKSRTKDRS